METIDSTSHPPNRRVLGIVGEPMNGVSYVRFFQPFGHLRQLGFELETLGSNVRVQRGPDGYALPESMFDGVDAVIFPQLVAAPMLDDGSRLDLVTPTCEIAARRGLKVVYSVDDHVPEIDPTNPNYDRIHESAPQLVTILDRADAIFATTPMLADALSPRGKPIHVLPNAVDPDRWIMRKRSSGELRVGWAGSNTHVADLLLILPAVRKLQQRVPFRLFLQGLTHEPLFRESATARRELPGLSGPKRELAEAFLELTGMLEQIDHTHIPFTGMERYFDILPRLDLDIGLCPLADTAFNRHKSGLKFYEYAVCGTMTVASAVEPYAGEVSVTVANDADAWGEVLERYLRDPERRDAELATQREFVLANRNIQQLRRRWADALHEVLS